MLCYSNGTDNKMVSDDGFRKVERSDRERLFSQLASL